MRTRREVPHTAIDARQLPVVALGQVALGLAMTGVMLRIGDFLFGRAAGIAIARVAAVVFMAFWVTDTAT